MDLSTTKYGHLKYTVKLADIVALGANLSGDVALDSLPPGTVIHTILVKASTAISGGTIATAVAQLKLNGTLIGGGTVNVFNTTGAIQLNTTNPASLTAANALAVTLTTTVGNLNAATAGQVDIVINYHTLGL
jgi:hypothetical protein